MRIFDGIKQYFYDKKIDKYFKKMGLYDSLLILQGSDREYCLSSMKVQLVAFYAKKQPDDVALLLLDSAKKYASNRNIAINFLENTYRKFALEAIKMGVPNIIPPQDIFLEEEEEPESFHKQLDEAVSYCSGILKSISSVKTENDNYLYDLCAEFIVYISTFVRVHENQIEIPKAYWNTFKAGIENRMLAIKNDGSPRSGLISTPNGQAFASLVSGYYEKIDILEEKIWAIEEHNDKNHASVVIGFLESEFHISIDSIKQFESLFGNISNMASKEIIPVIIRVFELDN